MLATSSYPEEGLALGMNPTFWKLIRRARREVKLGKVVSLRQVKQELAANKAAPNKALRRTRRKAARR